MTLPSSPGSASVVLRREARFLRASSAGVASKRGELRARRPSSLRRLWPGEATLLAAAVLWLLVLLYVGIGEWRRMVHDSRTDVGEIGER
jgi:ferric-dicitrate binding protein FerR (iron transport regulator)